MDTTADRKRVRPGAGESDDASTPTRDEERLLDDESSADDLAELDVPFETPVPDVLDQHREVPLDDERDE